MNNISAKESIEVCLEELNKISKLIDGMGKTSNPVPFLTKYAIIKSCGTIEYCFKTILSDVHNNQTIQVKNFIDKMFRHSSINPSKDNICKSLDRFDVSWNEEFKNKLKLRKDNKKIESSLMSLNSARNTFAHGGHPSASFENVVDYFNDSVEIIKIVDGIVR